MRPAFAAAGANGSAGSDRAKIKDLFVRSEVDEDFNAFGEAPERPKASAPRADRPTQPKRPPQRRRRPQNQIPWKPLLLIGAAVLALILIVVVAVVIFSAPQKNIKLEDNVYFTYVDSNGKYRIVSNDDTLKQTFDGEIEIIPAKDASFAYVLEQVSTEEKSGYKMYILKGNKLTTVEATADSKPIALAEYEPGIVYKENSRIYYYSEKDQVRITSDTSADNFIISGDASVVVYTMDSAKDSDQLELKYFCKGASNKVGPYNFIPSVVSIDGKYIYGVYRNVLCYITVEEDGEEYDETVITNNTFGEILGITGINVEGNEIIFCAQPLNKDNPISYMYKIKDSEPKQIAEGIFTPIYSDSKIVCPESFLNSYLLCEKTLLDEEENINYIERSTYFLDKNDGARKIASGDGQFSPDEKYFYYINEEEQTLVQVDLKSKDFSKNTKALLPDVTDFAIIESGDLYVMVEDVDKGFIYFWDCSDKNRSIISHAADLESMELCANSVYFSETNDEDITTIYVSTEGSAKKVAEFKSSSPTDTPEIDMGVGKKGFAYFVDESGKTKLFYTSNGKKFSVVSDSCIIPDYSEHTPPSTDNNNSSGDQEAAG